ncbi:hypothetical protein GOV11_03990 [Candidatus Woesearchaeota archaeon]|nr:hypothetical protein [Candidatus Woesearchaeota archaeon]
MEAALTLEYGLFLLSVVITALGLVTLGGLAKTVFGRRNYPTLKNKLAMFPIFILAIIFIGWFSEKLQIGIFEYLQQNTATSLSGLAIAVTVAWILYDWVLWRKK